jgi:hypothetical protein
VYRAVATIISHERKSIAGEIREHFGAILIDFLGRWGRAILGENPTRGVNRLFLWLDIQRVGENLV